MPIEQISFSEYRSRPGLNSHYLIDILKSPALAKYNKDHDSDSPALKFGRAFHTAILEPDELLNRYAVKPADLKRNTKAGKAAYKELEASGKEILDADEFNRIGAMQHAIYSHPISSKFFGAITQTELSLFWRDENGHENKARLDAVYKPGALVARNAILDVKTCVNANPRAFQRAIDNYGYALQAAHYLEGANACELKLGVFLIIAVESEPPHQVAVYQLDQDYLDICSQKLARARDLHRECTRTGIWPGHEEKIHKVLTPAHILEEEY